jgi:hypothetical protein
MPDTSIFDALPTTDSLGTALNMLPTSVKLPAVDVTTLGADIGRSAPGGGDPLAGTLPDLSAAPSVATFRRGLDEPLAAATAIDGPSLIARAKGSLPAQAPAPTFDVQGVIKGITDPVLPAGTGVTVPSTLPMPPELGDFSAPLRRLGEAGAATPLRLLQAMLAVLQKLVETATDVEKIKTYTAEALGEILVAQTGILRDRLPLATLEQARAAFDSGYLDRIEKLLADLDRVKSATGDDLLNAVTAARDGALPALRHCRAAAETLGQLRADDTAPLKRALDGVTGFATGGEVFLQDTFDSIEARVGSVLDAVAAPVQQLAGMIEQIRGYLKQAAEMAGTAAQTVADNLDAALRTVSENLKTAREQIEKIAAQVRDFIKKVDVSAAIEAFKGGCTTLAKNVDGFFTQVEDARQQLDAAVTKLSADVETRFNDGLAELKKKIETLLGEITGLLDRDDVKQVLDQARQGVDKLKEVIDQASLQVVFDVVVRKTGELEGRVRAIDTARLGTPQKMALKVGVKIIKEVNIVDVVQPELEAVFAEILEPLRELIGLLRDRVLVVEQRIDEFRPGALVAGLIDPHLQNLFDQLDSFRPSQALQPVKDALEALQKVLEQLDPQRLLDRLQGAYAQLRELVDGLEPTSLNAEISRVANTAVRQITTLRDVHLEDLLRTVRENVSLQKLLEGTGVQEIADAELWERLRLTLGGGYLDQITAAVDGVEKRLAAEFGTLDYGDAAAAVVAVRKDVEAQRAVSAAAYRAAVDSFVTTLDAAGERVAALERTRAALVAGGTVTRAEVDDVLRQMDLKPVLELLAALRAVAALDDAALTADLAHVKAVLTTASVTALKAMTEEKIRQAVPDLFKAQIGDPVRGFVTRMKVKLKPFADAVTAIQDFVRTALVELPKQVDAAVGKVLDAVRTDLRAAAGEVIETIGTVRNEITATIDAAYRQVLEQVEKVNPTFVLSSFGANDVGAAEMAALADKVARPGQDEAPALLQARLSAAELTLVTAKSGDYATPLRNALNGALRDDGFTTRLLTGARDRLEAERRAREAEIKTAQGAALTAARKALLRALSLGRALDSAQRAYASPATKAAGTIRLNRVLLELSFPAELPMGVLGLHPYVVALVGDLYPAETVAKLDATYGRMVARLRTLPQELVAEPLDAAFGKVKKKLHDTFDIRGLFRVLDIKLDGMEGDLSKGLDRLSLAYDRLVGTLDERLSA